MTERKTERKLQTLPNNQAGYLARRGEILASLGPIGADIYTAIAHGRKTMRKRLEKRRAELERELITLDDLNQRGYFSR